MKYYSHDIKELPLNKPIYGFAYNINDDTRNKRLNCLPVLGEIAGGAYFIPYKKKEQSKKKFWKSSFKFKMVCRYI